MEGTIFNWLGLQHTKTSLLIKNKFKAKINFQLIARNVLKAW